MPDTEASAPPARERFWTFLDLSAPADTSPGFCVNPLYARDAFESEAAPWFATLYLQRTTPVGFRNELAFALSPANENSTPSLPQSDEVSALLAHADRAKSLSPLRLAHLSRALVYLGFPESALSLVRASQSLPEKSPEDAYWAYCSLFVSHLFLNAKSAAALTDEARRIYHALSDDPRNARVRLNVSLLGLVWEARFAGRSGGVGPRGVSDWTGAAGSGGVGRNLRDWRDKVREAWVQVERSNDFSPFEKNILQSRVYRATSFVPYFEGDFAGLESEMNACLTLARSAQPIGPLEDSVRRDNLLGALESASRTRSAVGDPEGALSAIEEITREVEPYDAKPWLQLGELHDKRGNVSLAENCYRRAGLLAPPMGMIAWFKLGGCLERQGKIPEAQDAYLSSLGAWPKGLTPLLRLLFTARSTGDGDLLARTSDRLGRALADPFLPGDSRAKIKAALSGEASGADASAP